MSFTTISETIARFLAVFGLFVVIGVLAAGVWQAVLVSDVYNATEPSQLDQDGHPDAAAIDDPDVRRDWQDAQTIASWIQPAGVLGLGSILTAILLTFGTVIYRGVDTMGSVFPRFWQGYLTARTGRDTATPDRDESGVTPPFGGGA